jgi:hypothetical protein
LQRLSIEVKPSRQQGEPLHREHGDRCWEADVLTARVIERALDHESEALLDRAARRADAAPRSSEHAEFRHFVRITEIKSRVPERYLC